jgi:glyoxylase-like metal-dependent hydrolase (beta-lactamase superfamily II)
MSTGIPYSFRNREVTMHVAAGVEMLELSAELMSGPGLLCPALLWDRQGAVLIDAGLPGMAGQFLEAIKTAGVSPQQIVAIVVTHHDLDHIGSLGELRQTLPQRIVILSHPEEVPYIQGERPPIKMTPKMMEQMQEQMMTLPEERRQAMRTMMEKMKSQKNLVDGTLADGEILPYCGGIQIIHTPGHTPGHICLYHKASKTLIAGDSLCVEEGRLSPAPAFINADTPLALSSLKRLSQYDIANVIAYHGGLFQDAPNTRIAEIIS